MPTTGKENILIPVFGILRLVLAASVALLLAASQDSSWPVGAYLAVGISIILGGLLTAGWPKSLRRRTLECFLIDILAITLLVASTGGQGSLFSSLYFLAALGLVWVRGVARIPIGIVALVLGCVIGVAAPERSLEPLLSYPAAFEAGLLVLFGVVAALGGVSIRAIRQEGDGNVSALVAERRYAEEASSIASRVGPLLAALSMEERLHWTAETVCEALAVPYAHATTSDGFLHQTSVRGDSDAYPSWWHPEIQRLVLWSCRTGEVMHSDEEIHGTKRFVAVPLVVENGESVGAIVAGGRSFDAEDVRALRLLAAPVASTLTDAGESLGGLDPISGLPNQDSLDRVLHRELTSGKPLALVMVDLDYSEHSVRDFGFAAKDSVLRAVGKRLREVNHRVFRCADGTFAVLVREVGRKKVRAVALKIRGIVEEAAGPSFSGASGFVVSEGWQGSPGPLLDAAREALSEARGRPDRISEARIAVCPPATGEPDTLIGKGKTARVVRALEEAIEVRDPKLGEHSRIVSRLSYLIGARMAFPAGHMETLVVGGLLHDIGKIGLPDSVLNKPGALSAEEYETVKQHPMLGARILGLIPELSSVVPVVRHHHERFDGRGYPEGLRGKDIPLPARIVLVADAFDSMTRDRAYRFGTNKDSALAEITCNSGTQFDPEIVEVLREILTEPDIRQASL